MKMKLALGVVVSLTAITLNTIPTENDTKMRMENEIICEIEAETKMTAKIQTEDEMADSIIPIQDSPQTEISSTQPKIPVENVSANEVAKQENYIENKSENVNPDSNPPKGKVYVEGFGYIEVSGPTRVTIGYSDGDINKMVGTMD